ncbi:tRNA 2-thiouridine(34) synthase MnmA [Alphaproteobacteria bacterium endosymbiont of Tiliacea citrago]|uniref:tRNA 2-thiouridine(34) synthase MnmA n=1 Tax=Alphaproteobacteria bacterium endosymbiont of Tiliacea citrago TaxID=3077944 RepID=UPI00313CF7ED
MLELYIEKLKKSYPKNSKIVVAMSGGVDSSVTASLIHRAGFETIGITLQLYRSGDPSRNKTCCSGKDIKDAQNVAFQEDFKHYILDYTQKFKEKVIDDFVDTYESGATPIPCGRCNQYIKFGYLLDFCKTVNADFLVTGHYVKKIQNELFRGEDTFKDQSYFLALTTKEQLKMLDFPLASINKSEVRTMAKELNLVVATKYESMDICFIPDGDYKGFLKRMRPEIFKPGNVISDNNEILGTHNGLAGYTVGQRKGLNLPNGPWFVKELRTDSNELVVCKKEQLYEQCFFVNEINLLVDESYFENKEVQIQVRSRQTPAFGMFFVKEKKVVFNSPQEAICKGQICAFYNENQLLGGCIIETVKNKDFFA